jgi:hypothetical protein
MNRDISHVFAFVVVAVASCGGGGTSHDQSLTGGSLSGTEILLSTEKSSYQGGDPVELTIQNQEPEPLGYNACTRELEVREGATWVPGPASLRLCSREVWYVDAGATRRDTADLDIGLTPGEYRIVLSFTRDSAPAGQQVRAVTNAFTIVP